MCGTILIHEITLKYFLSEWNQSIIKILILLL